MLNILRFALALAILSGCTQRIARMSYVSTRNVDIANQQFDRVATGVSATSDFTLIAMGLNRWGRENNTPSDAVDKLLNKYDGDLLANVQVSRTSFVIPIPFYWSTTSVSSYGGGYGYTTTYVTTTTYYGVIIAYWYQGTTVKADVLRARGNNR